MTPLQEVIIRMANKDQALLHLINLGGSFRADMDYRVSSGPSFDPHEGPVMSDAQGAFGFIMRVVIRMAEVRSTTIDAVENPCNTEFLPADMQKAILDKHGLTVPVSVNGVPA